MTVIPDYLEQIQRDLEASVEELEKTFPFAQALFTEQDGISMYVSGKDIGIASQPPRRGAVLSVYNGGTYAELATSDISPSNLKILVDRLKDRIKVERGSFPDPGNKWSGQFFSHCGEDPRSMANRDKLDHLQSMQERLSKMSPRIVSAPVRYGERVDRRIYVNRNKQLFQELINTVCVPVAIVSDGKSSKVYHAGNGIQGGFEIARISDAELAITVENAERLLTAKNVEPGIYDVVGGPALAGVIAHEAFGHGVESDMFLKKRAMAARFIDKSVASDIVNLIDNPALTGQSGSYFFDDEGYPATETRILENGVLRRVLTDQLSAMRLGIPRTANGRRESYANKVYTRMSNSYFGPGAQTVEEMISSVEYGLYMPDGSNGMEDPKSWGIQVESPYAVEIRRGKLTNIVYSPVVITGFVPELLNSITMIGKTVGFMGLGTCQKGHKEQVKVAIGGPALKMKARVG
ncbi:TldD/PmbA family protein [bacterium]|nr:TldD/PmbA family protein [candidate division CSSED10-310 bacterium]